MNNRDFITEVFIAAANQKEEIILKEILRSDQLKFKINKDVVLTLVKNDLKVILK